MNKIVPIVVGVAISFAVLTFADPISHPKSMLGKWDAKGEAAYTLMPFGFCTNSNKKLPGRWFVKDGYVYLSCLFAYEEAEIISDTEWMMHEKDPWGANQYDRQWTKIE